MHPAAKSLSIRQWRAKYESYVFAVARTSTARRYARSLNAFFTHFRDRRRVDQIYTMDIEDYKAARTSQGIKPQTINHELAVVRAFYNWLIEMNDVPTFNPAAHAKRLPVKESPDPAQETKALLCSL
jgi:site-specific recombinase XerD